MAKKNVMTPSTSPGRGARVVAETDTHTSGWSARSLASTVPLPTAVGPVRTIRRPAWVFSVMGSSGDDVVCSDYESNVVTAHRRDDR